jgi:hypothetical protein
VHVEAGKPPVGFRHRKFRFDCFDAHGTTIGW